MGTGDTCQVGECSLRETSIVSEFAQSVTPGCVPLAARVQLCVVIEFSDTTDTRVSGVGRVSTNETAFDGSTEETCRQ